MSLNPIPGYITLAEATRLINIAKKIGYQRGYYRAAATKKTKIKVSKQITIDVTPVVELPSVEVTKAFVTAVARIMPRKIRKAVA